MTSTTPAPTANRNAEEEEEEEDVWEASSSSKDQDRQMDARDFQREQFNIFKHNFREAFYEQAIEMPNNLALDANLKKSTINALRKLQRAQTVLGGTTTTAAATVLAGRMGKVHAELSTLIRSSSEYSPLNIELPRFNRDDMELLFGQDDLPFSSFEEPQVEAAAEEGSLRVGADAQEVLQWIGESNATFISRVNALLGQAEELFREQSALAGQ